MKISNFKIIPILIRLLLCQVQACKSSKKKGWYVKIDKVEYEEKLKEFEEAKAKEKELSQKLLEEKERNNISAVIEEEEKILAMQELPVGSKEKYVYLPEKRDDQVTETGRPNYLPIDPCQAYRVGCSNKTKYLKTSQQKRSIFTSESTKNNAKQINKSPGKFLAEMVESIAKPVYNWVILPIYNWIMLPIYNWIMLPTYNWMILPIYNKMVLLLASHVNEW